MTDDADKLPPPGAKEYAEAVAAFSGCPYCKKLAASVDFWKGEAEGAREGAHLCLEDAVELLRERDEARSAAGRLLFRFASGADGDPWREEYDWLSQSSDKARDAWHARNE